MAEKTRKRPQTLYVCGLPYDIVNKENPESTCEDVSTSDLCSQTLYVMEDIPFPRWLSYVAVEIAVQLLEAAGRRGKPARKYADHFGPVLYRFLRENKFDWIYTDALGNPPPTVFINGMPYTVSDEEAYLDVRNLCGQCDYLTLSIKLHSRLKAEGKAVVFCHEAAHAMLYEARLMAICNDESVVEPLSYFLYQLLKQNDFSFAYNG